MPNYICKCCEFSTERKSNYEKHMNSAKHLTKQSLSEAISVASSHTSSISSLSYEETKVSLANTNDRYINDLENQLKMKDIEIQNIINEYTLKLQMKDNEINHKDEIIAMLKQQQHQPQPVQKQRNPINLVVKEVVEQKPVIKESTLERLKRERPDAISIETFIEEYLNTDENDYLLETAYKGTDYTLPKYVTPNDYVNGNSFVVKQICELINKLPQNKRPIYCSDASRKAFFIFTNNGWIKSSNEEEINKILKSLFEESYKLIRNLFVTLSSISTLEWFPLAFKQLYDLNYEEYKEKARLSTCVRMLMHNFEEMKTGTEKLKIELSKLTSNKNAKYVPTQEKYVEENLESEYNCEDDPNN